MSATTPGLVCAHQHLYSALARGMPPPPITPTNFQQILDQIWWRLDVALDADMIRACARLGAVEALERGTTAMIDHHSSPSAIEGSLDIIAEACEEVGVRVNCCYEVTDRNGLEGARLGLAENERFLRAGGRGYVGAHACFTMCDETLHACAELAAELGTGVHIHVAEGPGDVAAGARLEHLATDDWIVVHAVHLDRPLRGTLAHTPRSNMNNSVGRADPMAWRSPEGEPARVVLGTDGIGGDMLEEFRVAFARHREADVTATPDNAWSWLQNGYDLFPEAKNDLVTWSYAPMDPWHLAYSPGVRPLRIERDGEILFEAGEPTRVDAQEVRAHAREQAARLHARL
jgi:cytosine/adenosine deaminase-related metal-dependent hydrolase